MRTSTKIKSNMIRALLYAIALTVAISVKPATLMAYEGYDSYGSYELFELLELFRTNGQHMVIFDPSPGNFPATETAGGWRLKAAGERLARYEFPPDPYRYGYVFEGWHINGERVDEDYLVIVNDLNLGALWASYGYATATTPSPSPDATPSPTPTTSPTPTPAPAQQPSAPNPNPPNPTTNPIAISLMIFGAVTALGTAAFGIINLFMRHMVAVGQYNAIATRFKRESRLVKMLGDDDQGQNKDHDQE